MNKKRRTSSVSIASRPDEEMADEITEQSPVSSISGVRKRKRLDPSELCQQLYDSIRNLKKEDGSMLCDTFIRAPKRRQLPAYYEVVNNPIDLLRVQQKLKTDSYDDIEELTSDIELLVNNAKAFYPVESPEYHDASILWETFLSNKTKILDAIEPEEPRTKRVGRPRKSGQIDIDDSNEDIHKSSEDELDPYEELFTSVMIATDPLDNQRSLHTMFELLPSKRIYPDYYDIIEHPIDLKFIATKIQRNAYNNLSEMEKDLLQMTKNACTFNEPGSQIYKDAKTLKKIFTVKKFELETGKARPTIKNRRKTQTLSAITAALKEEQDSSEEDLDDDMDTEGDGPLWQLFDQLYNTANASGAPLGESLWKLPNRRFYPEYYVTVKKPISMAQIRNKLKKGDYVNVTDMTSDLYLMLDNAKKAFPITHKSHKDALKMQKVLNSKLIDQLDQDSDGDEADLPLSTVASIINTSPSSSTASKKLKIGKKANSITPPSIISTPITITAGGSGASTPKGRFPNNPILKKKLLNLQKFLTDFTVAGRKPMTLFMEKPSKKQYPDYYDIIQHPIDMNTIEKNIIADRYGTVDDVVGDYRLMFANCRKYNEEGSMIYEDANILERALNEKLKEFSGLHDRRLTPKVLGKGKKAQTVLSLKMKQMYDAIRDYREPKANRQLSSIFLKLPSKNDYPDYYDIIKNPIDMERIGQKMKSNFYDNINELAADFMLMFENACKYNEPDSQIYKDALLLQQICIQTKQALRNNEESVPDVPQAVQELLLSLFTTIYNHQDEEGRCFSDSLAELPEYDEIEGTRIRAISLDLIKRRLDKCLYKRLDIFQEDVFACLDRARRLSRTDSQIFEDSIELQAYFIKKRDEFCKDVLSSPALSYSAMHLSAAVEAVRQSKLLQEEQEQEIENEAPTTQGGESMILDQKVYTPGDFVYYDVIDNKIPGIIYIERLWTNQDGIKMMYGNVFLRPPETFHVTTRKFLEQEVFKSDQHHAIPLSHVVGKCFVMSIKDYIKFKPEGFADKDVYVCESRYSTRARSFKKIKTWPFVRTTDPVKLIQRDYLLEPKRIMSVYKDRVEKHKGELAELQLQEALVEKDKPNVVMIVPNGDEENIYYEQYNTICSGVVKIGDFVYVATESGKQSIAQVTAIWDTKDGKSYFRGPWLLTPPEVPGTANRYYFRQELLLSTIQETNPTVAIVGRCAVLDYTDYTTNRPTEIPESDVFICESLYDEHRKQIKRLAPNPGSQLRKYSHSQMVTPDEYYQFKTPLTPMKVSVNEIAALQEQLKPSSGLDIELKTETTDMLSVMEDSMDGGPPSVGSDLMATASPAPSIPISAPVSTKKGKSGKKLVTGYILYSSEVRKDIAKSNPECTFGDISRIVGNEWRQLPAAEKQAWEEKASKCNEESAAKYAEEHGCPSPAPLPGPHEPIPNQVFECMWDKCDYQYEEITDCLDHALSESNGHIVSQYVGLSQSEIQYHCLWRNCLRFKKNAPAFPNLLRLIKHVRDVHINKGGKIVMPHDRSKNYFPSKKPPVIIQQSQQNVQNIQPIVNSNQINQNLQHQPVPTLHIVQAPPAEPLFVTVPPRPQRVLHSEAYIKYMEGLQTESRFITPWEKTIKASQETISKIDVNRLPTNWLGKRVPEKQEDVISAMWNLRNYMMKDVLQIQKHFSSF